MQSQEIQTPQQNPPYLTQIQNPCIILAGAGTGKTQAIIEKTKYLIENKIFEPEKIVCITFSNEAANSIYERIEPILPENPNKLNQHKAPEPLIKTFHAFSADLLRQHGQKIGIKEDFKILTPDDAKIVIHKFFRTQPNYCHKYIETIHTAKDLGITIQELEDYIDKKTKNQDNTLDKLFHELHLTLQTIDKENKQAKRQLSQNLSDLNNLREIKKFLTTWKAYEKIKKQNNYQDYSDLNNNALKLLKAHPEITNQFQYFIVDEFQDTNKIQLDLLYHLAPHKKITVVGDLNQSIYKFRGAYRENIAKFKQAFNVQPENIFNLDKSYRSSDIILSTAHNLIINNYQNQEDCFEVLSADNRKGKQVQIYELKNAKEEARKVVEIIQEKIQQGEKPEEICVIFRTHQQGRIIKNTLEANQIPYYSVTKKHLLKQDKIKTTINYLKLLDQLIQDKKGGDEIWWDLIYQLGFEQEDLIQIGNFIKKNRKSENISKLLLDQLPTIPTSQNGKFLSKILIENINYLLKYSDNQITEILKQTYKVVAGDLDEENQEQKQQIAEFNKFYDLTIESQAMHYNNLHNFVHYLNVLDNLRINIEAPELENNGVRLMTAHATKGLEYNTVIITNLAQKRFPIETIRSNKLLPAELSPEFKNLNIPEYDFENQIKEYEKKHNLLEERRLCYVSFTRAKNNLILTFAREYAGRKSYPSQFLQEINYKNNPNILFKIDEQEKYKAPELKITQANTTTKSSNHKIKNLSPSALLLFNECQKKFEYKYIYNMPEKKPISWEQIRLGSFIHLILEKGVNRQFNTEKQFIDLTKQQHREEEWQSVDLDKAIHLIKIFYIRNKSKYNRNSKTEQFLQMKLGGLNFIGFADRIDFTPNGLEIIDYKTGQSNVFALNRNWQLGYYALAAQKIGKVHKITLDMLQHDKPLEFELDSKGVAHCLGADRTTFNLYQIEQELVDAAHKVAHAYEHGFQPCEVEKGCEFCGEFVY